MLFFKVKKASFVELQWFPFRRKKDSDTEFSLPSVYFLCMCERVYVFGSHAFTCIQRKSCLANQTNHRIDAPHIKIWKSILLEKYKHSARSKIEMWCKMAVPAPRALVLANFARRLQQNERNIRLTENKKTNNQINKCSSKWKYSLVFCAPFAVICMPSCIFSFSRHSFSICLLSWNGFRILNGIVLHKQEDFYENPFENLRIALPSCAFESYKFHIVFRDGWRMWNRDRKYFEN